jgi:hypothetical protein
MNCPSGARLEYPTVALRVVGGDEKRTQCPVDNWAALFLGDINTGTLHCRLGESQMRQNMDAGVIALARPRSNCTSK